MIHLESLLVVLGVVGHFSPKCLDRNLKLVGQPLKMMCGRELPGKAASWICLRVDFHHIKFNFSVYMHSCFSNVLCLGANEDRPLRSGQEKISTEVESESQIRPKKAILRRRSAPLSKGRDCQKRSLLFRCLSEPHFLEAGF